MSVPGQAGIWAVGALCLALGAGAFTPALAHAQDDDWSITRERPRAAPRRSTSAPVARAPQDARARYLEVLRRQPDDAFALERLRTLALSEDGSLEPLRASLHAEVEARPEATGALEVLARLALSSGQPDLAERYATQGLERAPNEARLLLLRADIRRASGRPQAAEADYTQALEGARGPLAARALRALGELALDRGDQQAARQHYARLVRALPGDTGARAAYARALQDRARHAEAAQAYLELAEQLRGDPRAAVPWLREAAAAQLASERPEDALATLDRAVRAATPAQRVELRALEVEVYRRLDRLPELAERLEREGRRGEQRALRTAGELWEELGEDARALALLRTYLARTPRDVPARERLLRTLSRFGDHEALAAEYRKLTAYAPEEPKYWIAWAEHLRAAGSREEALSVLEQASRRAPRAVALHTALAELYTRWGEHARARRELELLARLEPDEPAHVIALGEEALARGDAKQAASIWQRLLRGGEKRAAAHATLGQVLADHDMLEPALSQLERALSLEPENASFQRQYASLLERAHRLGDAEAAWQRALALSRGDVAARREARKHLVGIWRRQGVMARRAAELEVRRAAGDLDAMYMLAEVYARDPGRAVSERAVLEQIVKLKPDDVEALRALERAHLRSGKVADALAVLERLAQHEPSQASAHLARAVELALENYRDEAALTYARRALELRPDDAATHRLMGELFRRRQELEQAIQAYTRAARLDPRDVETRATLAQLEAARGNREAAATWWLSVLTTTKDDALALRAGRAVRELAAARDAQEQLEKQLLELALASPQRSVYRRLLVEAYGAWLGPVAARVEAGEATDDERERLEQVARRALKPLLEALADDDDLQRTAALDLLSAMRVKHAAPALFTVAERGKLVSERARALLALGRLGEPAHAPRLRALLAASPERRLRPFILWALLGSQGSRASDVVRQGLADVEPGARTLAALYAGAWTMHEVAAGLNALAQDPHAHVRLAARWALRRLGKRGRAAQDPREEGGAARAGDDEAPLGLHAAHAEPHTLARALFSSDARARALSARLLWAAPRQDLALADLPAPRWPFSARAFVDAWGESLPLEPADEARLRWHWPEIEAAALRALQQTPEPALAQLSPHLGGLVPTALLGAGPCVPAALARQFAQALRPSLVELASAAPEATRARALVLLAQSGAAEHPALLSALGQPSAAGIDGLLDALSPQDAVHPALRGRLLSLFDAQPAWPVRLRIARLLGPELGTARLENEPVELVRRAAKPEPRARSADACPPGAVEN